MGSTLKEIKFIMYRREFNFLIRESYIAILSTNCPAYKLAQTLSLIGVYDHVLVRTLRFNVLYDISNNGIFS